MNSYCLVASEEIPQAGGMFHFTDIDRDGMVDMVYLPDNEFSIVSYFNKLNNDFDHRNSRVEASSDNY